MTTPAWRRYLTFWRSPVEQDVDDELRFHTNMRVKELVARGMSEEDARRAVAERLGNVGAATSECVELSHVRERNKRNAAFFDALRHDLRYAIRGLRARPAFAAAIILTLGLGIGANAAVFSVVDRLLFRTAPMLRDVSRTQRVYVQRPNGNGVGNFIQDAMAYGRFTDFSAATNAFTRTAGFATARVPIGAPEEGRDTQIAAVTASFFSFFDAPPTLGRYFNAREDALPSGEPVVVLSYPMWQLEYGGRTDALGAKLRIGQTVYTVIGVAPRWFAGLWPDVPPMAFIPFSSYAASFTYPAREGFRWWTSYDQGPETGMLVTLASNATIDRVGAELTRNMRSRWSDRVEVGPPDLQPTVVVASTVAERGPDQSSASKVAALIGAMAVVVLLIAAANVASLLLARALRRRREMAVRLALGISRRRLITQLLTETGLLALLGGLAGLIAAGWAGPALRAKFLSPSADTAVATDVRTLLFVGAIVIVAATLTGLAPALQAGRIDITRYLRIGVREGTVHRSRARAMLLVIQGALSVLLLVGAGLFVRSLVNARHSRLGYDAERLLAVNVNMRGIRLDSARNAELWTRLEAATHRVPGVEHASLAQGLPFVGGAAPTHVDRPSDIDYAHWIQLPDIAGNAVTPDYFATMQTRILRGRGIDSSDVLGAPPVIVVSNRLAKALWPGRDALGQCAPLFDVDLHGGRPINKRCAVVVGIAEDIKVKSLGDDPTLYFYLPFAAEQPGRMTQIAVRTHGDAERYEETVRGLLQREMPASSYVTVTALTDVIGEQMRSWRLGATMFVAFGVLAMILAAVGLYSAIAYNVTERTHEMVCAAPSARRPLT